MRSELREREAAQEAQAGAKAARQAQALEAERGRKRGLLGSGGGCAELWKVLERVAGLEGICKGGRKCEQRDKGRTALTGRYRGGSEGDRLFAGRKRWKEAGRGPAC